MCRLFLGRDKGRGIFSHTYWGDEGRRLQEMSRTQTINTTAIKQTFKQMRDMIFKIQDTIKHDSCNIDQE